MRHSSTRGYVVVFAVLIGLTAATVGVAYLDVGPINTPAAIGIAGLKAVLVGWFFMHLDRERGLTWVYAIAGLLWLAILAGLTLSDYLTRVG